VAQAAVDQGPPEEVEDEEGGEEDEVVHRTSDPSVASIREGGIGLKHAETACSLK
jgi:hypothetical protein